MQLQDNRPKSVVQKMQIKEIANKQSKSHLPGSTLSTVQRVKIEKVTPESESILSSGNSSLAIQLAGVTQIRGGAAISTHLLQTAIQTMTKIVSDAEQAVDEEKKEKAKIEEDKKKGIDGPKYPMHSGKEHQRLTEILTNGALQSTMPKTSNSTFGLGGSNYFGNTPFTTTQGSSTFSAAVSNLPGIGKVEDLGNRKTGLHDEMYHITEYPGLQALASSQGHCLFCYGTIHGRGYQHGSLRDSPWPQQWHHDFEGFGLKLTNKSMDTIGFADNPVIKIKSDVFGERYYFVTNVG
jgi:hypothetical protein